jgi:hypothetical protein
MKAATQTHRSQTSPSINNGQSLGKVMGVDKQIKQIVSLFLDYSFDALP